MDAEEARRLLTQAQLDCQILEIEKEAWALKATKFRNLLRPSAGEDGFGATQSEGSHVPHATRSDLTHSTLSAAGPSSGREVLSIARSPSADPPVVAGSHDSSSDENCASARRLKRNHFSNVPRPTTSKPCDTRKLVSQHVDVEGIFKRAGLTPLILTRAEASRAKETPSIKWKKFFKLFGATVKCEWPQCSKVPGYKDFLCTSITAQPFMPVVPGKPGLFLRLPAVIETPQSDCDKSTFQVFSATQPWDVLHYRGKYTKIPLPQIQFTLADLPKRSQEKWIKLVGNSPAMRILRARIDLRNRIKREPSASEVQDHMRHQFTDQVTYRDISAAFRSEKEKLVVEGIKCIEYDSHLATMIQRESGGQ